MFFSFQLMFKLISLRIFTAMPLTAQVSSGLAAWICARLAWTKVLIQAVVHGKEYSSVCMCRCVFEWPYSMCACCSREREARQRVFTHAWSIHSPITAVSTHTR